MKTPKKTYSLTLDPDVMDRIKKQAEKEGRSLSNYINRILKSTAPSDTP